MASPRSENAERLIYCAAAPLGPTPRKSPAACAMPPVYSTHARTPIGTHMCCASCFLVALVRAARASVFRPDWCDFRSGAITTQQQRGAAALLSLSLSLARWNIAPRCCYDGAGCFGYTEGGGPCARYRGVGGLMGDACAQGIGEISGM